MKSTESNFDIYTMEDIYQSSTHCSKINLECALKCNNFSGKHANGYMFETNCSSIEQRYKKLGYGLQKKVGKNNHTFPMCDK